MSDVLVVKPKNKDFYYHIGTKNTSFLSIAKLLKDKYGVKNNKFMLKLYDRELAGLDPTDEATLTRDQKIRIAAEIVKNPWYYLREFVRVPTPGGNVYYDLHLGNLALTWLMINNINAFLVLPRQNYKTVSAAAVYSWFYYWKSVNAHTMLFNKAYADSQNNLKRIREISENFPDYAKQIVKNPKRDSENVEYLFTKASRNRIDAKPNPSSSSHADRLGRGATTPGQWYDELAFIAHAKTLWAAAAPALAKAMLLASRGGKPHGVVITTTPNMLSDESGKFAHNIKASSIKFTTEFYDRGPDYVKSLINASENAITVYVEYSYQELGHDEAWFREQCKMLQHDTLKIKRELLLEWPNTGEGSIFSEETIDEMRKGLVKDTGFIDIHNNYERLAGKGYRLIYSRKLDPDIPYVVGIDTSEGQGLDYHAITLTHPITKEPVAYFTSNTADDEDIKQICKVLFTEIFPYAYLVVEAKTLGVQLIRYLRQDLGIGDRLFYAVKEKIIEVAVGGKPTKSKQTVRVYGVATSTTSRDVMIAHLRQNMIKNPKLFSLEIIQDQIVSLVRKSSGKIEHRSGAHDDALISHLLAHYAIEYTQPQFEQYLQQFANRHPTKFNAMLLDLKLRTDIVLDEEVANRLRKAIEDENLARVEEVSALEAEQRSINEMENELRMAQASASDGTIVNVHYEDPFETKTTAKPMEVTVKGEKRTISRSRMRDVLSFYD